MGAAAVVMVEPAEDVNVLQMDALQAIHPTPELQPLVALRRALLPAAH